MKIAPTVQKHIRDTYYYDPKTGFIWKNKNRYYAVSGCRNKQGYVIVSFVLNHKVYSFLAHRLGWFLYHGEWAGEIDHINQVKFDNRIENLREATRRQNTFNTKLKRNNKSGYKGVYQSSYRVKQNCRKTWMANIMINGKYKYLGCYETAEEAGKIYDEAARQLHCGFYHNTFTRSVHVKAKV